MKKSLYFWFFCTFVPFMMLACPKSDNETTGGAGSNSPGNKEMVDFFTQQYLKKCPNGMNSSIKAKIVKFAKEYHTGMNVNMTIPELKENFLGDIGERTGPQIREHGKITCDNFYVNLTLKEQEENSKKRRAKREEEEEEQ